jgi:hypothetical protein
MDTIMADPNRSRNAERKLPSPLGEEELYRRLFPEQEIKTLLVFALTACFY